MSPFRLPFTREELVRAFRLVLSDAEAEEMVRPEGDGDDEQCIGISYTPDTLILLSLCSPELDERVRAHLRERLYWLDPGTPRELEWTSRRNALDALRQSRSAQ